MTAPAITREDATAHAKAWIGSVLGGDRHSQMAQFLSVCVESATAETLRLGGSEYDLDRRIDEAHQILAGVRYAATPTCKIYQNRSDSSGQSRLADQDDRNLIWSRRDPEVPLADGYKSPEYVSIDRDTLSEAVSRYLAQPWLRHPALDWIIVDMFVTNELVSFGEAIKRDLSPEALRMWFPDREVYFQAEGHTAKMAKLRAKNDLSRMGLWALLLLVTPLAAVFGAIELGFPVVGIWLGITWGIVILIGAIDKTLGVLGRVFRPGEPDVASESLRVWYEMHKLWRALGSPVVNPTNLHHLLETTASLGAVWDQPIYAIVDRCRADDPAVWLTAIPSKH